MNLWLIVLIAGGLTFLTRLSFIILLDKIDMPPAVRRALQFVPVAVLSAIIFPELFLSAGKLAISPTNARLIAGIIATLVAWRTRNAILTIAVGMASLWLLQAILP